MTRQDFCLIAAALLKARYAMADDYSDDAAQIMADALATTNPRFDRARFLSACGVEA